MQERLTMPEDRIEISSVIENRGAIDGGFPDRRVWSGDDKSAAETSRDQAIKLFELEARIIYLPVRAGSTVTCVDDRCPEAFNTGFAEGLLETGEAEFPERGPRSAGGTPVVAMLRGMARGNAESFEQDLNEVAREAEDLGAHYECYALGKIPAVFNKILLPKAESILRRFAEQNLEGQPIDNAVWETAYGNYQKMYVRLPEYLGPDYEQLALDFIASNSPSASQPEKLAEAEHNISAFDINLQPKTTLSREAIAILSAGGVGILGSDAWYPRQKAAMFYPDNQFVQKVFIAQHDIYTSAVFTELSGGRTNLFLHHDLQDAVL